MLTGEAHGQTVFLPGQVVQTIDTATGQYSTVPQAVDPVNRRLAVSNDQSLLYAGGAGNTISVINSATGEIVASIAGITPNILWLSPDGTRLYATDPNTGNLSVISTATNHVISTTPLGFYPYDFAVTADGAHLYIPAALGNSIAVVDTATGAVTATITVANRPQSVAFSPDGTRAYVSSVGGEVSVIDTTTNTVLTTIAVGGQPAGLLVSPDGLRIYLASQADRKVYVIDTASNTVITTISVGAFPSGLVYSADGSRIYVANYVDRTVSVIDASTNSVIGTIGLSTFSFFASVCANGNALLASGRTFTANSSAALSCTLGAGVSGPVFTGGTMLFAGAGISSSLPIDLQAGGGTFNTAGNNATLSGTISGIGGLTKTGDGTLTLSGTNSYHGGTNLNGGVLSVSSDSNLGDASGALSFNGGILRITGTTFTSTPRTINWGANGGGFDIADAANTFTVSQNLTGSGGLTKLGAGTLVLAGSNTYSGATVISAGTLAGGVFSLSANSAHTIAAGATLDLAGNWQNIGSLSGAGTVTNSGGTDASLITGTDNTSATFSGVIQDGASRTRVKIDGTGITTFTGTNTYTGGTAICFCSTLQLGSGGATGSIVGDVTNSGTLIFNRSNSYTFAGVISDGFPGQGKVVLNGTGETIFTGSNTYSGATTINAGTLQIGDGGTSGSVAGNIVNNAALIFNRSDDSTYGGVISGSGTVEKRGAGALTLAGANTYTGATTITAGTLEIQDSFASPTIVNNGTLIYSTAANAGTASITNNGQLTFFGQTTAGSAVITNSGTILFDGNSTAGNAQLTNNAPGAVVNFFTSGPASDARISAASIAGGGRFDLNSSELTVGGNNLSTTVTGVLTGDGFVTGQSLVKTGTGTLTLAGINTYTGATTVNAGTLSVDGSIASSSLTTVNAGATLGGTGTVGNTLINGGTLAPGNSIGTLTVQGNLAFTSAARYMIEVSPASADRTNVAGTATLGGAAVNASFAPGSYVAKKYTILNATGGLGGSTFSSYVTTNLPDGFKSSLSYDNSNAYLDLELNFVRPATAGAGGNQQSVGNVLVNSFNSNGGIPLVYGGLTANGLTQVSGETTTGSQQTGINAMTQFMGMMMDPSAAGRGDAPPIASDFAATDAMAYAPETRSNASRDADAAITKAMPRAASFEQRWSVWSAGFGGSQTTDGNAAAGSNSATSRIYGAAAGADVWLSPTTLAGISMAGGATSFSVAQGGTGQSDLVQVGGFVRHGIGSAYLSAAFAYGWQDITTERLVTVAGVDRLRARFNANSYAGRIELGSRSTLAWLDGIGIAPYAAAQVTAIDLPAYAESAVAGSNAFALSYAGKTVTAPRTELGLRADKAFALDGALLTLRGRAAWAHDFNTDRAASATFQALPGASFVVNGAAAARDAALTSASAEVAWRNGFALAATFEGEFSDTTRSYAGKGMVRYAW